MRISFSDQTKSSSLVATVVTVNAKTAETSDHITQTQLLCVNAPSSTFGGTACTSHKVLKRGRYTTRVHGLCSRVLKSSTVNTVVIFTDENSVRPSVRPSVRLSSTRVNCDKIAPLNWTPCYGALEVSALLKRKQDLSRFIYHTKDNLA